MARNGVSVRRCGKAHAKQQAAAAPVRAAPLEADDGAKDERHEDACAHVAFKLGESTEADVPHVSAGVIRKVEVAVRQPVLPCRTVAFRCDQHTEHRDDGVHGEGSGKTVVEAARAGACLSTEVALRCHGPIARKIVWPARARARGVTTSARLDGF